jgi:hypothetical protein
MTTVNYDENLPISATEAWAVLADFAGFLKWAAGGPSGGATLEIMGDEGIGMIRRMTIPGLGIVGERLVRRDADNMVLSYEISEGKPLGMDSYIAVVTLTDTGDGACHIDWQGTMTAVEGADEAAVADSLLGSFIGMSEALKAHVAG